MPSICDERTFALMTFNTADSQQIPQGRLSGLPSLGQEVVWPLPDSALRQLTPLIEALKADLGYSAHDIVTLSLATPNLEGILAAFRREHHHSDDEVRLIVAGAGVFGIVPDGGEPYELSLAAGDWIVIPAMTRHWFDLTEARQVVAVRLFKDNPAWAAIYTRPGE